MHCRANKHNACKIKVSTDYCLLIIYAYTGQKVFLEDVNKVKTISQVLTFDKLMDYGGYQDISGLR